MDMLIHKEGAERGETFLTLTEFLVLAAGCGMAKVQGLFPGTGGEPGEREVCEALFSLGRNGHLAVSEEEAPVPSSVMTEETAAFFRTVREAEYEAVLLETEGGRPLRYAYVTEAAAAETEYQEASGLIRLRLMTPASWIRTLAEEGFLPDPAYGLERIGRRDESRWEIRWEGCGGSMTLQSPLFDIERQLYSEETLVRWLLGKEVRP